MHAVHWVDYNTSYSGHTTCHTFSISKARDTKRFWWRLWLDNGRPRDGEVFKCYKNVRKLYRKITRQCIYAHNNELYRSLDSLLCRDVNRFWNSTKKLKKSPNHASVNPNRLVEHFSSIMQDSSELSHDHSNIADIVNKSIWMSKVMLSLTE